MKIEKGIELLEELKRGLDLPLMAEEEDALKLGIEALKRIQSQRKYDVDPHRLPLVGETT